MTIEHFRNDTIANVLWKVADNLDKSGVDAAKAALTIHMREKHPGKKYRLVRELVIGGEFEAWIAVPLDG